MGYDIMDINIEKGCGECENLKYRKEQDRLMCAITQNTITSLKKAIDDFNGLVIPPKFCPKDDKIKERWELIKGDGESKELSEEESIIVKLNKEIENERRRISDKIAKVSAKENKIDNFEKKFNDLEKEIQDTMDNFEKGIEELLGKRKKINWQGTYDEFLNERLAKYIIRKKIKINLHYADGEKEENLEIKKMDRYNYLVYNSEKDISKLVHKSNIISLNIKGNPIEKLY